MEWLIIIFHKLKILFKKIMAQFNIPKTTKEKRPTIHEILLTEFSNGEIIYKKKWILVNVNGETLNAPIFDTEKDATYWLDEKYPKKEYSPE